MTRDTRIGIINPKLDADTVFGFCATLIGAGDNYQYGRSKTFKGIAAASGQGYPAWLIVSDDKPGYLEVSFDTAYGYTGTNGEGCTDLHAWLIREIARWVPNDTTMFWYDEFTGHWHQVGIGDSEMEEMLLSGFKNAKFGDPDKVGGVKEGTRDE